MFWIFYVGVHIGCIGDCIMCGQSQLCDKGHGAIEEAERQYEILLSVGPITSDTLIRKCVGRIDEILILLEEAEGFFDKAIKAGSYYGLKGTADDGMAEGDDLRVRLDSQEERLVNILLPPPKNVVESFLPAIYPSYISVSLCGVRVQYQEDEEFRRPLKVFASKLPCTINCTLNASIALKFIVHTLPILNLKYLAGSDFVRLENADDFAMMHHHDRQRKLNEYFASILLQVSKRLCRAHCCPSVILLPVSASLYSKNKVHCQAYVRRKQERIRFCAVSARSLHLGRFVPISSQASLGLAPLNDSHQVCGVREACSLNRHNASRCLVSRVSKITPQPIRYQSSKD